MIDLKNPNGYGSIVKLSGKRRNPYAAVVTVSIGQDKSGVFRQKRKYIGYYATRKEALHALDVYHQNPGTIESRITFSELYQRWSEEKYPTISESNQKAYIAAYKAVPMLHEQIFAELQPAELQRALDDSGKNPPTKRKIVTLFSQMYRYASFNRIIAGDVNPAPLLNAGKVVQSNSHHRFTAEEIEILWQHSANEYVQVILMMIYTGVRPGELFGLQRKDVHLDDHYFYIRKAKNQSSVRVVPIHDKVLPFFKHWYAKGTPSLISQLDGKPINFRNHNQYTETYWIPILQDMDLYEAKDAVTGEVYQHKPHDCRHTFASLCADAGIRDVTRRKVMGHSGRDVGEQVYTHLDIQKMVEEINQIP